MRILHAGRNSANQAGYVVKALRTLGHDAEMWEYGPDDFGYHPDRSIPLEQKDPLIFWRTFSEAIERFDIINFHAGRSFFPGEWGGVPAYWDLPILRALGKKVFHTFHGSDARIKRIHLEANPWSYYRFTDIRADDDRTEKIIQIFRTYTNKMFVTAPDYLRFVPEAEVIGRVIDLAEWPEQRPEQRRIPVIVHAPSHRGTKGTDFILGGVERLRSDGVEFEFHLIEGVSHDQARRAIQDADVVIDNVITGDYELVSIEAMASNRVAVANLQGPSLATYPDAPVFNVDPDTLVERLRALIGDVSLRRSLAEKGRSYVESTHQATVAARRLLKAYELPDGPVPQRTFPDWASIAYARRIETLEQRAASLEISLARSRRREQEGRGRTRSMHQLVPEGARARWGRFKARAKRSVPAGIRRRIIERRDRRYQDRLRTQNQPPR